MSNYTKSTNFATKDNLTPGDPLKIVRGTEIDTEFNNIATAIATKTDNASAALTGGTINDTTIGATTASTGAFTTLAASGNVTLSGGTANGVAYLNGSKVVTSGSALTFDGSGKLALGNVAHTSFIPTTVLTLGNSGENAEIRMGQADTKALISKWVYNATVGSAYGALETYGQTNYIQFGASDFRWQVASSEQMRLTSTGLGIGTSSPAAKLDVSQSQNGQTAVQLTNSNAGASTEATFIANNGTYIGSFGVAGASKSAFGAILASDAYIFSNANVANTGITLMANSANGVIKFATGGSTEKMRLDTSGNLGLGVTPSAWSSIKAMQVGTAASFSGGSSFNDAFIASNAFYDGSNWKYINSNPAYYSSIGGSAAARWYNAPSGTAGNAITFTQAMTLDASNNLLVGTTTAGGEGWTLYPTGSGGGVLTVWNRPTTASTTTALEFRDGGTAKGSITYTNTATAFNTSSDYRLKNTIAPMTGALAKVALLKPCTYKWNADGSDGQGFIAHELAEVCPDAVTGEKDGTRIEQYEISPAVAATYDEDGNELTSAIEAVMGEREVPQYQGIDVSFLVATLTAAIQELKAEFDAYKASHP